MAEIGDARITPQLQSIFLIYGYQYALDEQMKKSNHMYFKFVLYCYFTLKNGIDTHVHKTSHVSPVVYKYFNEHLKKLMICLNVLLYIGQYLTTVL